MNPLDRLRLLVVENESGVKCDMAVPLAGLGYEVVRTCRSGEEAVQAVRELAPDLVLVDLQLRGATDGIETARRIRQISACALVYVTTSAGLPALAHAQKTQPQGYLLKPFSEDELRLTLEVAMARQQLERQQRQHEAHYADTFRSLNDGVITADLAGVITFMNEAAAQLTGWSGEEALHRSLQEVFRVFRADGSPAELEAPQTTATPWPRTLSLATKAGNRVTIQDRLIALRDQQQSLSGLILQFRAAAPANESSSALSFGKASAPLPDAMASISDPLIACDGNWRISYANAAAASLFTNQPLTGASFWDLLPTSLRDEHHAPLAHAQLHREALTRDLYLEANEVWLELRGYPHGDGMLLLLKDITARHEEAEKRHRLDRLESLGLLARGFAHDFNNLLTVLLGNLSLAEMRLHSNADLIPELTTAKQATVQAQNLVQQLLTFARGGAPIKRPIKPSDLIEQFFQQHPRTSNIAYNWEVQPELPAIAVDAGQVHRLLSNLVRNAEQAMHNGGEVMLRCFAPQAEELGKGAIADAGDHAYGVIMEVRDTGEGITAEHLPHIFEPYFSTRNAQNATGLGLTVCESIAKAHGGSLSVRSEPGQGTTVRFYLPVDADDESVDEIGLARSFEPAPSLTPRILILEDDPLVRSLISRSLASQGFEVCETPEGSETIRRYQESLDEGRRFDLVVLDLTIPNGLGGVRTMERLRQIDPNVCAIVSSGYSDDPVMAKPTAYGFSAVLPKPYEPADLLRLVKSVLNARSSSRETKA